MSKEFQALPMPLQTYLRAWTVPHWELATHTPFFDGRELGADEEVLSSICLVMNPQSRGCVTLASADPCQAPLINPAFLSHSFDRRVMIEAMREMLRFFQAPVFRERMVRTLAWPEDNTDEAILVRLQLIRAHDSANLACLQKQCKSKLQSSWHACGTAGMGRDPESSCVDSNFRVFGTERLRVVDMSVCPLIPK